MEKVYDISRFRASEKIDVAEYFKKYSEICPSVDYNEVLTDLNFGELEIICNPENLRLPTEALSLPTDIPEKLSTKTKFEEYYPINEECQHLNVIKVKQELESKWTAQEFRFGGKRFIKRRVISTELEKKSDILPSSDFIFTILVYKPCSIYIGQKNSAEKLRMSVEIEALGKNLLSEVVDIIDCETNSTIITEVENPHVDLTNFKNAKKKYPSQTVFIDGVFYNDTRTSDAVDLTEQYIQWAKDTNIGKFTTSQMHQTYLRTLTPRFGYPYVYIHQGNCEHIFVFSDARLIQNDDCLNTEKYPKIVSVNRNFNIKCVLCTARVSQWMVKNCDRFPQEKVFLCTECCDSYLYIDGKKITDFQLYPYFDEK